MNLPQEFTELLDECAELVDGSGLVEPPQRLPAVEALPSLLEQTQEITQRVGAAVEPVRIVTHFACTGGTLIAKCIASMPNTSVLSEVAPHSSIVAMIDDGNRFYPTDLIQLCRLSDYPATEDLRSRIFLSGLREVHGDATQRGLFLVLRDHAHSKYCVGADVSAAPTLREDVGTALSATTVVTVRHPLDSFLSLLNNGWRHFRPFTIEEYSRRYRLFLDDHADQPLYKYEKFIEDPLLVGRAICEALQLPFNEHFADVLGIHRLSGDSGRRSNTIAVRSRRAVPDDVREALASSDAYLRLCERLDYEPLAEIQDAQTSNRKPSPGDMGSPAADH